MGLRSGLRGGAPPARAVFATSDWTSLPSNAEEGDYLVYTPTGAVYRYAATPGRWISADWYALADSWALDAEIVGDDTTPTGFTITGTAPTSTDGKLTFAGASTSYAERTPSAADVAVFSGFVQIAPVTGAMSGVEVRTTDGTRWVQFGVVGASDPAAAGRDGNSVLHRRRDIDIDAGLVWCEGIIAADYGAAVRVNHQGTISHRSYAECEVGTNTLVGDFAGTSEGTITVQGLAFLRGVNS